MDKNGKSTTVHKKTGDTSAAVDRISALDTKKNVVKKTLFKPGKYNSVRWNPEKDIVELGAKDEGGRQDIYFNGRSIGSVSSNAAPSTTKIKGTRLVRHGAMETTWRADTLRSESPTAVGSRSSYARDSRADAVTNYVNSYLENIVRAKENENFINNGGISFSNIGTYHDKKLGVNGTEIIIPSYISFGFNSFGGDQFDLKTDVSLKLRGGRAEVYPNTNPDADASYGQIGSAHVFFRTDRDSTRHTAYLAEDGSFIPNVDDAEWFKEYHKTLVAPVEDITKQIVAARQFV